jgi:hypothetical protein
MEVRLLLAARLAPCQTSWQGNLCRTQTVEVGTRKKRDSSDSSNLPGQPEGCSHKLDLSPFSLYDGHVPMRGYDVTGGTSGVIDAANVLTRRRDTT